MGLQVLDGDGDDASSSSGDSDFGDKVKAHIDCTCCLSSLLAMYRVVVVVIAGIVAGCCWRCLQW